MHLKNSKMVMVTGAEGFIGSHLIKELLKRGYIVKAFDLPLLEHCKNLSDVMDHKNLNYFSGDIRDKEAVEKFFCEKSSVIFHLASVVGVRYYMQDPLSLIEVSIIGTKNILEHCLKNKTRILFSSTSEIYGKNNKTPWDEDSDRVIGNPSVDRWSYSSSKALVEHMLFALSRSKGLKFSTVRFFNVYGPKQNPIYVVSQSLQKIMNGERPEIYDSGEQNRCFTYVEDVIEGIILAATKNSALGHAFNIGNNKPTTISNLVNLCLEITSSTLQPIFVNTDKKYGSVYEDIEKRIPKVTKAKKILGWSAKTNLKDGLKKTYKWISENKYYLDLNKEKSSIKELILQNSDIVKKSA